MKNKELSAKILVFALMTASLGGCATKVAIADPYGKAATGNLTEQTIVITPEMKHVNVQAGQVVTFVVGEKQFSWHVLPLINVTSFPLNEVAPPGLLDHPVKAYVSEDPRYKGMG